MKPILFSTELIPHILRNRKTQTRRVIKPQLIEPVGVTGAYFDARNGGPQWNWRTKDNHQYPDQIIKCPYGKVGDRLWVRETWAVHVSSDKIPPKNLGGNPMLWFKADRMPAQNSKGKWRPSIFMPRWASRIQLLITGIRAERIQDMSFKDWQRDFMPTELEVDKSRETFVGAEFQRDCIKKLWDKINSRRGFPFDLNPWVWVVDFEIYNIHHGEVQA